MQFPQFPQLPLQNFWIYSIAIVALMCSVQYLSHTCLPKSFATPLVVLSYLALLYIVISSLVWNNDSKWEKAHPTQQKVIKNVVDSLFVVIILVVLYCHFFAKSK